MYSPDATPVFKRFIMPADKFKYARTCKTSDDKTRDWIASEHGGAKQVVDVC